MFPAGMVMPPLAAAPREAEVMTIDADGDKVQAWFFTAPDASADHPAPVAVFFHGNAELIDYQNDVVSYYRGLGCSVLLPEYRGYGHSDGTPSQDHIRADAVRFYDMIAKRQDVDSSRIFFHGRSIGSAVAIDVATERKPAALIVQSAFTNGASMAHGYLAPGFLLKNPFRNDRSLAGLDVPMLIFHGSHDEIIPVTHGRALHALLPKATYVELNCGHNDFPGRDGEKFRREVEGFLRQTKILR